MSLEKKSLLRGISLYQCLLCPLHMGMSEAMQMKIESNIY